MTGNKQAAFSLIEVVVSVTLFSAVILAATSIFKMVIDSQRGAMAAQNVQESLKFFLEVTEKEIRMAKKNNGVCPGLPNDAMYGLGTENGQDTLSFRNYYGECVKYAFAPDRGVNRFRITRNSNTGFISPAKISLDRLDFIVRAAPNTQPLVTINIRAHATGTGLSKSDMTLQSSITSRYYK